MPDDDMGIEKASLHIHADWLKTYGKQENDAKLHHLPAHPMPNLRMTTAQNYSNSSEIPDCYAIWQ
ncbi:hypothetical protein [Pseudoflavonifractor phocaeensis]|uniref:hypothetical protein n=1 Tax=Pseudoflavonifractor phocaeensis TaxID=1870988 RepID=UPI0019599EDB|nr:hypothetical protein [Pseudoflavonifractor phocaeensis]MBM6722828.1 hypothetical protein [Pseudoflavonifractor phocaeensis]